MSDEPLKIERMQTKAKLVKNKTTTFASKNLELVGPEKNPTFGQFDVMRMKNAKDVSKMIF